MIDKQQNTLTKIQKKKLWGKIITVFIVSAIMLLFSRVFIYYIGSYTAGFAWALIIGLCSLFYVFEKDKQVYNLSFAFPEKKCAIRLVFIFTSALLVMIPLSLYGDIITNAIGIKEYSTMSYTVEEGFFSSAVNCAIMPILGTTSLYCLFILPRIEILTEGKKSLIISALFFAFLYLDDIANILPRFILGLFLAYAYKKSKSVFLPMCFVCVYLIGTTFTSYLTINGNAGGETMGFGDVSALFFMFFAFALPIFALSYHRLTKGKKKIRSSSIALFVGLSIFFFILGFAIIL